MRQRRLKREECGESVCVCEREQSECVGVREREREGKDHRRQEEREPRREHRCPKFPSKFQRGRVFNPGVSFDFFGPRARVLVIFQESKRALNISGVGFCVAQPYSKRNFLTGHIGPRPARGIAYTITNKS